MKTGAKQLVKDATGAAKQIPHTAQTAGGFGMTVSETAPEETYTRSFYQRLRGGATRSAEVIVPLVLQMIPVRSVVDVGCGDGSWLAVFRELGVNEGLGIDGDYVDRSLLQIPQERFRAMDLTRTFALERVFDLAVSLEVAEHLPAESAATFVECLTRLAPFVLFSAAIPSQGGQGHVNEQWQDQWAALFRERGYLAVDFLRRRVWSNDDVEWWYAQNTLLFARENQLQGNAALKAEFERTDPHQLRLVHPKLHLSRAALGPALPPVGARAAARLFLVCLVKAITRRVYSVIGRNG